MLDRLLHCSNVTDDCPNLVYSGEAITGERLLTYFDSRGNEVKRLGLYCDECAMALGHFPQRILDRIELMLRAEGMLDRKSHPRNVAVTDNPDQGRLL